jgi:hypothetical protein
MTERPSRHLTMADLAILVVGVAISLWLFRFSQEDLAATFGSGWEKALASRVSLGFAQLCLPFSASLVAARMIPLRPRWRVVFRQPGTVASLAILAHMLFVVLSFSWNVYLRPIIGLAYYVPHFNTYLTANWECGAWVGVAWATLTLSGTWRPEPSWIDRTGRLLGVFAILFWIGMGLIWW